MQTILYTVQIIVSLLLVGAILIQNQSAGVGGVFGGDSGVYRTRRGAEKILFRATIVLAAIFLISTAASLFLA